MNGTVEGGSEDDQSVIETCFSNGTSVSQRNNKGMQLRQTVIEAVWERQLIDLELIINTARCYDATVIST
jgi:hypothetical protein